MTNPDPKLANPWSRRPRLMAAALMAVGLLAAAAALWSSASKPARLAPVSKVTVALPTQLKSADMAATSAMADLQERFGPPLGERMRSLDDAVQALDFERALQLCAELMPATL